MTTRLLHAIPATHGETGTTRRIPRRVASVLAGLLAIFVGTTAVDLALHAAGVFPSLGQRMADGLFLLAIAYRIGFGIAGCYLSARLAPDRPLQHALVLGLVGFVLSTAGAVAMWDAGPAWYSIGVIAISFPCAWAGGRLRIAQLTAAEMGGSGADGAANGSMSSRGANAPGS